MADVAEPRSRGQRRHHHSAGHQRSCSPRPGTHLSLQGAKLVGWRARSPCFPQDFRSSNSESKPTGFLALLFRYSTVELELLRMRKVCFYVSEGLEKTGCCSDRHLTRHSSGHKTSLHPTLPQTFPSTFGPKFDPKLSIPKTFSGTPLHSGLARALQLPAWSQRRSLFAFDDRSSRISSVKFLPSGVLLGRGRCWR